MARPTEDRKVTRSIRVHGIIYFLLFDAINITGGVAKWSTAVDSNLLVHHQLLFEGAGSNPVSVALFAFASNSYSEAKDDRGVTRTPVSGDKCLPQADALTT